MKIEEVQQLSLTILKDILYVAKKINIKIYPIFGTLLGVVRHDNKFIPWDDDIDVAINANDSKKFFQEFEKMKPKYTCQKAWEEGSKSTSHIIGINIKGVRYSVDFFEIRNIKQHVSSIRKLKFALGKWFVRFSKGGGLQKLARILLSVRSKNHYAKVKQKYTELYCTSEKTDKALLYVDDDIFIFNYKKFTEVKPIVFYAMDWYVTKNPEEILEKTYGDWKKIPSDSKKIQYQHYDF